MRSNKLLDNAEAQVDNFVSFNRFDNFEWHMFPVLMLKVAHPAAKQHGNSMDKNFVNEAMRDKLLGSSISKD